MKTPNVAIAVFAIPELTESILLHLKTTHLVNCLRISRSVYNTVWGSRKLKQNLFQAAVPSTTMEAWVQGRNLTVLHAETGESGNHIAVNPIFGHVWEGNFSKASRSSILSHPTRMTKPMVYFAFDFDDLLFDFLDLRDRRGARFGMMFITQPPVQEIKLLYKLGKSYSEISDFGIYKPEDEDKMTVHGMTATKVIDCGTTMEETIKRCEGVRVGHVVKRIRDRLSKGNRECTKYIANEQVTIVVTEVTKCEEATATVAAL